MMTKRSSRLIIFLLALLMVGYAVFFSVQLLLHYYSFGSRALDLGNMNQAIWNTLHGRPFHQTNQPGITNRLSLHVEPILAPISLLYLFYSGPEILFIFQSIVVALGAVPVFALARFKLKNDGLALIFAGVYLMFPAIQGATLLDFHAITLAPTFLLAAFYFVETRNSKWFTLFAVLAAACKEDITLLVLMMGFYAFFVNRQRHLGIITVALCVIWAYLAVFVIPPAFAGTGNIHWNRYGHLGDSPLNIVLNLFIQPQLVLTHLQKVQALDYLRLLLTPTAFTALLNPLTLCLALPSLGINLLSDFPPMQRANSLIYAAPIVPAVVISSIYGVANLKRLAAYVWRSKFYASNLTQDATRQTNDVFPSPFHTPRPTQLFNTLIGGVILTAAFAYHLHYGYFPWGGQFRGWEEITAHHRRAERLFAQIPPDAALSAQDRLTPHLSQRETLYIFDRLDDADHIALDVTEDSWPLHPVELRHKVDEFLEGDFGVVAAFDGYLLLAKKTGWADPASALPDEFFDFARVSNPATFRPQFPISVTFDDKLKLLGYDLSYGAHEDKLPVITLYWQALQPLEKNYNLWPFSIDRSGQRIEDPGERPLVTTLWYPTTCWSPDEIILTRTLPWDLGQGFTLAVGVSEEAWDQVSERLPITQADDSLYLFENKTWARLGSFVRTGRHTYEAVIPPPVPPSQLRQAQFWNLINLTGLDLPIASLKPGESLPFTLYWQSSAPITVDLKTFAHLLDENNNIAAQLDWTPQDQLGYLPTSAWQPHRTVADSQAIPLPDSLAAGQYRLVVGWYYPVTGERLPLTAGEGGDTALVGEVTIR